MKSDEYFYFWQVFCKHHDKDKQKNVSEDVCERVPPHYVRGADEKNIVKREKLSYGSWYLRLPRD